MEPGVTDRINITVSAFDIHGKYFEFGDIFEGWIWDRHLLYRDFYDIGFLQIVKHGYLSPIFMQCMVIILKTHITRIILKILIYL
jgi:hypothetical protein